MITKKGTVVQTGADTFTAAAIDTNLTADGKSGWQILAFAGYWSTGETAAATDQEANLVLATEVGATLFDSNDEIIRLNWAVANTGGIAVAYPKNLIQREFLINPRITVQPLIYVHANTVTTGLTNTFYYELHYEIVKLTDLEVLKLLQGGA